MQLKVQCSWLLRVEIEHSSCVAGPFLHSDDSIVILNVKDDGRVGQKWHQLAVIDIYSVGLDRQRSTAMVLTVARYVLKPFKANIVVARLWMCCQGHPAHGTSRIVSTCDLQDLLCWSITPSGHWPTLWSCIHIPLWWPASYLWKPWLLGDGQQWILLVGWQLNYHGNIIVDLYVRCLLLTFNPKHNVMSIMGHALRIIGICIHHKI